MNIWKGSPGTDSFHLSKSRKQWHLQLQYAELVETNLYKVRSIVSWNMILCLVLFLRETRLQFNLFVRERNNFNSTILLQTQGNISPEDKGPLNRCYQRLLGQRMLKSSLYLFLYLFCNIVTSRLCKIPCWEKRRLSFCFVVNWNVRVTKQGLKQEECWNPLSVWYFQEWEVTIHLFTAATWSLPSQYMSLQVWEMLKSALDLILSGMCIIKSNSVFLVVLQGQQPAL